MANAPVKRDGNGQNLVKGSGSLHPGGRVRQGMGRPIENWRIWLRKNTKNGAEVHEILLELARGEPKTVKLRDGREQIIVPTAEVRARCAIHLDEMMHGKAVTQNEQQRAEREAGALAAVQALSYEELERRARLALGRGDTQPISDAEIIPEPSPEGTTGVAGAIFDAGVDAAEKGADGEAEAEAPDVGEGIGYIPNVT